MSQPRKTDYRVGTPLVHLTQKSPIDTNHLPPKMFQTFHTQNV